MFVEAINLSVKEIFELTQNDSMIHLLNGGRVHLQRRLQVISITKLKFRKQIKQISAYEGRKQEA